MRGNAAKQNDNIVAHVPEYGGNFAAEARNISLVSQFEIPLMTRMYGPVVCCKKFYRFGSGRSCINVSGL